MAGRKVLCHVEGDESFLFCLFCVCLFIFDLLFNGRSDTVGGGGAERDDALAGIPTFVLSVYLMCEHFSGILMAMIETRFRIRPAISASGP